MAHAIAKVKWNGMVPGFPDLAAFLPDGECVLFEVKAEGNSTTPAQKTILAQLSSLGFRAVLSSAPYRRARHSRAWDHWNIGDEA